MAHPFHPVRRDRKRSSEQLTRKEMEGRTRSKVRQIWPYLKRRALLKEQRKSP